MNSPKTRGVTGDSLSAPAINIDRKLSIAEIFDEITKNKRSIERLNFRLFFCCFIKIFEISTKFTAAFFRLI